MINQLIEDSILDAEKKGAKVIGLGLLKKVLINLIFWHESSIFLLFG